MTIQVSPGIAINEIDDTTSVAAVSTSTGGFAGTFNWGPVLQVTSIPTEVQLENTFGRPDQNTAVSFFTAANFLAYSQALNVARADGLNQFNATSNGQGTVINNSHDYFNNAYTTLVTGNPFTARYPGALGNSLEVIVFANTAAWCSNR